MRWMLTSEPLICMHESETELEGTDSVAQSRHDEDEYMTDEEWFLSESDQAYHDAVCFYYKAKTLLEQSSKFNVTPCMKWPPMRYRVPFDLPQGDSRFEKSKKIRQFVCDGCGVVVPYSCTSKETGSRAVCEFHGSFTDTSWKGNIPGELLHEAYTKGYIDCTWLCSHFCGAPMTGAGVDRRTRPERWRSQWRSLRRARHW